MQDMLKDFEGFTNSWWPYIISLLIAVISAIRFSVGGTYCESPSRIDDKVVIITGSSSGIGLATAKELAKREHGAQLKKGENLYRSGYVTKFLYDSSISPPLVKGSIMDSMKKIEYTAEMFLSLGEIERMVCDCPHGKEICHHMAALALHCHYNVCVTDKSCRWSKNNTEADSVTKIEDIYPIKKKFRATTRNATKDEIEKFKKNLADCHVLGFP